mgnify:CR=1 FL=1
MTLGKGWGDDMETIPVILENKKIRRKRHNGEWWFAVEDVCAMLMEGPDGGACWRNLKRRLAKEGCEVETLCHALEFPASDGTGRQADCVTLEGIFRLVQSVATPKAESLKRWLAQVGRIEKKPQGYRTDTASIFALLEEAAAVAIACRKDDRSETQRGDGGDVARKAARLARKAKVRLDGEVGGEMKAVKAMSQREALHE